MSGLVICGKCETANPPEARFCMTCGAGLERACPQCGSPAPPGARFCMACGASLESPAVAPAAAEAPVPAVAAEERRTVTVLFADLSGYTGVAERLDPEAVKR